MGIMKEQDLIDLAIKHNGVVAIEYDEDATIVIMNWDQQGFITRAFADPDVNILSFTLSDKGKTVIISNRKSDTVIN